jgi:hypothetical protein
MDLNNEGETAMSTEAKSFHFNVNVRASGGSKATMANNEDSFLRAMEIQERKQEKKELERLEEERIAAAQAPVESAEPVASQEETPETTSSESAPAEAEAPAVETPPAPPAPKLAGGNVPAPQPRRDFTAEERAGMLKRAKAHAAEVQARKK